MCLREFFQKKLALLLIQVSKPQICTIPTYETDHTDLKVSIRAKIVSQQFINGSIAIKSSLKTVQKRPSFRS